ncbi:YkvI family membrane protein [Maledivibacter halophilus]|uniref:Uncharacterized membrane protein YkvI n=1 Tax=Maledivibacter halophilus TaxID=36842 RepID=A0A1T5KR99_9FIRM|nr:hypothetical protein [Maledivibacter halophilus]SKC65798.1 Uncharacterized membrane protein YkvI [Maledivibacter halophilus]
MKGNKITYFSISTAFIGTLIGAGFASGQELMQFFGRFGAKGIVGSCLTAFCFSILGIIIMLTARNMKTSSYEEVSVPNVKILKVFANSVITFFSFAGVTVMIAGTGSLFSTLTGSEEFVGKIIITIIIIITTCFGTDGLINSFNIVVPVMIAIAAIAGTVGYLSGIDALFYDPIKFHGLTNNWFLSAMLFVSYNTVIAIAVLVPLGVKSKSKMDIIGGAAVGGIILGSIGTVLCFAIVKNFTLVYKTDLPMLVIAQHNNKFLGVTYAFVLFSGIFTTAAGLMFALVERLYVYNTKITKNKILISMIIGLSALFCSRVGFTKLVSILYPIKGYLGFIILSFLFYNYIKSRRIKAHIK